jgi:hypothetical protein
MKVTPIDAATIWCRGGLVQAHALVWNSCGTPKNSA